MEFASDFARIPFLKLHLRRHSNATNTGGVRQSLSPQALRVDRDPRFRVSHGTNEVALAVFDHGSTPIAMVERPPDVPSQPEPEVRTTGTLHSRLPNANRIALEVGSAFVTMQQVVLRLLPKLRYAGAAQIPSEPEYVWEVDQVIQQRAVQFVDAFNDLFDETLPRPVPENAAEFWMASSEWKTVGRCVRIGFDPHARPVRHYHWAIDMDALLFHPIVREFWDAEIWTTDRYRTEQEAKGHRHS